MKNCSKWIISFLAVMFLVFGLSEQERVLAVDVQVGVVQSDSPLNVRSAKSTNGPIIGQVHPGERIEFIRLDDDWAQMTYRGQLGYVSSVFLGIDSTQVDKETVFYQPVIGTITASEGLNVRVSPDSNADVIGKFNNGAKVEYIQVSTNWAQVTYNGILGFIHTNYLSTELNSSTQSDSEVEPLSTLSQNIRVVLDAGHGGHDPGAVVQGFQEKDIVYEYKEQIKQTLEADGIEVIETRSNDEFVSLAERVSYANRNNADLFLSIHANSYSDERVNGLETHFYSASREAHIINTELRNHSSNNNRGVYQSNLQVLRNATVPAVLVEIGYMTNANELYLLQSKQHRAEVSEAVSRAVKRL